MKKIPLIPLFTVIVFVILMTFLGFWQLDRAKEKEHMLKLLADESLTTLTQRKQLKQLPQYAHIEIQGHYLDAPQFLLDNQIDNQVVGYHVFTPFQIDDLNTIILVNRGWVAKNGLVDEDLSVNTEHLKLVGQLNNPPKVGIQLGDIQIDSEKSLQIITYFEEQKIVPFLHEKLCQSLDCLVSSKIIWLKQDQPQGFKRQWNPIVMLPSKHVGYAVQWFSMTLVLIGIFIYWLVKNKD
jgi:surfeit locus 1 family protein